jgi:hypothetical protein
MKADNIKGVQQLAASGVGCMMAVAILIVVDTTPACESGGISRSDPAWRWFVNICEKGLNRLLHRVRPAKRPYRTGLFERVSLFFDLALHHRYLAFGHGPLRRVMPVDIFGENCVGIEQRAVNLSEDKLSVRGGRRPVHETARLISGIVELLDSDFLGDLSAKPPCIRPADVAGKRDDEPKSGFLRVCLWCCRTSSEGEEHLDLVDDARSA